MSATRKVGTLQGISLLLPVTMSVMGASALTSAVPLMVEHFKDQVDSAVMVPNLLTLPALFIVLFSPVAGWLADRFGRRQMVIWAMALYAVMGVMPTMLTNFYAILASRCGVGICESVILVATTTMISDYFKGHDREKWLGRQTAVASLSALIIIPTGGFLASQLGWSGPFYLYTTSLIFMMGIILFTWEPEHTDHVAEGSSAPDPDVRYHTIPWARMAGLCGMTLFAAILFYAIVIHNGIALDVLGVKDQSKVGLLTSVASIGVPVGTFVYQAALRLHIGWLLALEFALISVGFFGMSGAIDPSTYTAWAFVMQLGCGMLLPTMLVWTTRGLAFDIRGKGTGMWQGAYAIGQVFCGALFIPVGRAVGGGEPVLRGFYVLAIVVAVALVLTLIAKAIWGKNAMPPPAAIKVAMH